MMFDTNPYQDSYPEPVTAVIHHRQKITWTTVAAYAVGAAGIVLAAITLTMFLIWKGTAQAQITELHQKVTGAQQAQASTAGTVTALSGQVHEIGGTVGALSALLAPYSVRCTTDLTGSNGPAAFVFMCRPG